MWERSKSSDGIKMLPCVMCGSFSMCNCESPLKRSQEHHQHLCIDSESPMKRPRLLALDSSDGVSSSHSAQEVKSLDAEPPSSLPSPQVESPPALEAGTTVVKPIAQVIRDAIKMNDLDTLALMDPSLYKDRTDFVFLAAKLGKTRVLEWLVKNNYVIVKNTEAGTSALHLACGQGHLETVKWLTKEGAIVAQGGLIENYTSSLMAAAYHGHIEIVRCLLQRGGAVVDEVSPSGVTALALAAVHGRMELAKLLVREGANPRHRSKLGFTPIHAAAKNGHLEFVKWLASLGVAVDEPSNDGSTPLTLASSCGHTEIVRWLVVEGKALVNHRTQDGVTSAGRAAHVGHLECLQVLIQEGHAQVDNVTNAGKSCIVIAAQSGRLAIVQWFILEQRANINTTDESGLTLLSLAAKYGHLHIARWLVIKGAAVEQACSIRRTPLLYASEYGHLEVVKCLVNEGNAQLDYITPKGANGVNLACSRGHLHVLKFLVHAGATLIPTVGKWSTLGIAAAVGHLDIITFLVREGNVEVEQVQNDGRLPLDLAAEKGHIEVVRWFLNEGRAGVTSTVGPSALQFALNEGHAKIIRLLVAAGSKIMSVDNVTSKQSQGLLLDALDKARLKRIREALCPVGWDSAIAALVGRYCMVSWAEAKATEAKAIEDAKTKPTQM